MSWRCGVYADWHVGSYFGLAPEGRQTTDDDWGPLQKVLWDWFVEENQKMEKLDAAVFNGDVIQGVHRLWETETYIPDVLKQRDAALPILDVIPVPSNRRAGVLGTPLHGTGRADYERDFFKKASIPVDDEQRINHDGFRIQFRHVCGRSDTFHGQATQIVGEAVREMMHAELREHKRANLVVRSHVHYHYFAGTHDLAGLTTPCMQMPFGWFGRRLRTTHYHLGYLVIVVDDGEWWIEPHRLRMKFVKPVRYRNW